MYTTLSPCDMCSGACYFYGIKRVILGENLTRLGAEAYLQEKGIEVVNMHSQPCEQLMSEFIAQNPDLWCVTTFDLAHQITIVRFDRRYGTTFADWS